MELIRNKKFRLYGYPFLGIFMYLLFILINPVDDFFKSYSSYKPQDYLIEFLYLIFFSGITIETGILVSIFLNKFLPWEHSPFKRFLTQLLMQIGVFNLSFYFAFFLTKVIQLASEAPTTTLLLRQAIVIGLLMSLLVTAFYTAEYFLSQWSKSLIETIALKEKNSVAQFEALKNQLDPHFLFNSFSILNALIEENKTLAIQYVNVLSNVYRYVLQANKKDTVKLYAEIQFIEMYYYLYKIRFEDAIILNIDVADNNCLNKNVCPMTLQLLIENAIKHNATSTDCPLNIQLYIENDYLVCSNNLIPKQGIFESFGIGLQNIKERYAILTKRHIEIIELEASFTIKIPLLND